MSGYYASNAGFYAGYATITSDIYSTWGFTGTQKIGFVMSTLESMTCINPPT
jgi:hypothetical protein